jgi:hypothetical protein
MSPRERKSIDNARWLCQNCAKLIDSDVLKYSPATLYSWKKQSEERALRDISSASLSTESILPYSTADLSAREIIELGENNRFHGDSNDLKNLATRCAIAAIDGLQVRFDIRLLPTVLSRQPPDPLWLPRYEKRRSEKAQELDRLLTILTAPSVHEWWRYTFQSVEDWILCLETLLARASITWLGGSGHKLDMWRTDEPQLIAGLYLADDELKAALQHMGLSNTQELRFGAYWKSASDLPPALILKHVIPRLVFELDKHKIAPEGSVLSLLEWHVGEG